MNLDNYEYIITGDRDNNYQTPKGVPLSPEEKEVVKYLHWSK